MQSPFESLRTGIISYRCADCGAGCTAADHLALMPSFCTACGYPNQVPAAPSNERWRQVSDANGYFEVSDFGRIRRVRKGRGAAVGSLVEARIDPRRGHATVTLAVGRGVSRTARVAKLVWQAFCGPVPPHMHVAHRSAARDHRGALCDHLDNLELRPGTHSR